MYKAKKYVSLLTVITLLLSVLPTISFASSSEDFKTVTTGKLIAAEGELINLYESTEADSPVLTQLESETEVTILKALDKYIHIQYSSPDGTEIWEGYVRSDYLSHDEEEVDKETIEISNYHIKGAEQATTEEVQINKKETVSHTNQEAGKRLSKSAAKSTETKLQGITISASTKAYASPSTSAKVIKSYTAGTALKFYNHSKSWYKAKIKISGKWRTVYLQKRSIETITKNSVKVEAIAKLNPTILYERPSTSTKKVNQYNKGYILKLYTYTKSWYKAKVKVNGKNKTAYVQKKSVRIAKPSSKLERGIALKNPTKVYAYVSSSAKVLKTYTPGSILKVNSYSTNWYRIVFNTKGVKKTGYIKKKDLEKVAKESTYQYGLCKKSPTQVYKRPSTNADTLKTYTKNTVIKCQVYSANWYIVKANVNGIDETGYIKKSDISSQTSTNYEVTLDQAVDLQMKMSPVTDASNTRVSIDEFLYRSRAASWDDSYWKSATAAQVRKYLDPENYSSGSKEYYQFLILSAPAGTSATEINKNVLNGKGVLDGRAASFIQAASTNSINEVYLISHALLETANGTSPLARGIKYNGTTVYNMYGIGAYDYDPNGTGAKYAYNQGWTSVEKAIVGGAAFVAKSYIHAGQDTLYKMRWNPESMSTKGYASHQYATDIGWAVKQTARMAQIYGMLTQYTLLYDIPSYRK